MFDELCLQFVTHLFYDSFICVILIIHILFPTFLKTRSTYLKFSSLKILNFFHLPSTFAFSFKKYVVVSYEIETLNTETGCSLSGREGYSLLDKQIVLLGIDLELSLSKVLPIFEFYSSSQSKTFSICFIFNSIVSNRKTL